MASQKSCFGSPSKFCFSGLGLTWSKPVKLKLKVVAVAVVVVIVALVVIELKKLVEYFFASGT